jgi:hypothetical protein
MRHVMTLTASVDRHRGPGPTFCPSLLTPGTLRVIRSAFARSGSDRALICDTHTPGGRGVPVPPIAAGQTHTANLGLKHHAVTLSP